MYLALQELKELSEYQDFGGFEEEKGRQCKVVNGVIVRCDSKASSDTRESKTDTATCKTANS